MVLRPSMPGNNHTGTAPTAGIFVKFENGVADVKDQAVIDMLLIHSNFGKTFMAEEQTKVDPFAAQRRDMEPEHDVTEIQFGHVGKNVNPKGPVSLTREQQAVLTEMAQKMAVEIAAKMIAENNAAQAEMAKPADVQPPVEMPVEPAAEPAPAEPAKVELNEDVKVGASVETKLKTPTKPKTK